MKKLQQTRKKLYLLANAIKVSKEKPGNRSKIAASSGASTGIPGDANCVSKITGGGTKFDAQGRQI